MSPPKAFILYAASVFLLLGACSPAAQPRIVTRPSQAVHVPKRVTVTEKKVYLDALSNDYGVTIPTDSVTIPKGETTGTFTIESAACPASNGAARLTAFYGGQLTQEITVLKPASCN
jgi:hypothetical protein